MALCASLITGGASENFEYLQSSTIPVSDTASRRRLRSASSGDLLVPATRRLTMGDCAFAIAGPHAWNNLHDSVHQSSSLDVFKQLLKTHLFSLSFKYLLMTVFNYLWSGPWSDFALIYKLTFFTLHYIIWCFTNARFDWSMIKSALTFKDADELTLRLLLCVNLRLQMSHS